MRKIFTLIMFMVALTMTMTAAELTVADGFATSDKSPVDTYNGDVYVRHQVIYPSSLLQDLNGASIQSITFYVDQLADEPLTTEYTIGLLTVGKDYFMGGLWDSYSYVYADFPIVYEGTIDASHSTIKLTFDTPWEYDGGAILMDIQTKNTGNYKASTFYGQEQDAIVEVHGSGWSSIPTYPAGGSTFLPMTTFEYTGEVEAPCVKPAELNQVEIGTDFVEVAWAAGGNENQWQVLCLESGTPIWDEALLVEVPVARFENLKPTTDYVIYVRSFCAEDRQSQVESLDVHTDCAVLSELPWNEDFETSVSNVMPECWLRPYDAISPNVALFGGYKSSKSLMFNLDADEVQIAILPEFDLGFDTLAISLWYNTGEYDASLEIGYINIQNEFIAVSGAFPKTQDYTAIENVRLADVPASAIRLAFRASASEAAFLYIDDIVLDVAPADEEEGLTEQKAPSTVHKSIQNGVLVIEHNGIRYNAQGTILK